MPAWFTDMVVYTLLFNEEDVPATYQEAKVSGKVKD